MASRIAGADIQLHRFSDVTQGPGVFLLISNDWMKNQRQHSVDIQGTEICSTLICLPIHIYIQKTDWNNTNGQRFQKWKRKKKWMKNQRQNSVDIQGTEICSILICLTIHIYIKKTDWNNTHGQKFRKVEKEKNRFFCDNFFKIGQKLIL